MAAFSHTGLWPPKAAYFPTAALRVFWQWYEQSQLYTGTGPASLYDLGKGDHPTLSARAGEDIRSGRGSLCLAHF